MQKCVCLIYYKGGWKVRIKNNEVMWRSEKGNVTVAYAQFDMGDKYKIYHKVKYSDNHVWEYVITFGTYGEALNYANKIHDMEVER